jgi:hypothetical protein
MFNGRLYAPLLHLRLAEVKGFAELPESVKALIFPIFRMRPWLGAATFEKANDKVLEIFPNRPFGYDLDSQALRFLKDGTAKAEFRALFNAEGGYAAFYAEVRKLDFAVPVARLIGGEEGQFGEQLAQAHELGRGLILPVELGAGVDYIQCANMLAGTGIDWAVYLNAGWGRDVLERAAQTVQVANSLLDVKEDLEIVISCSSFPDDFHTIVGAETIRSYERGFFAEVRRNLNRGDVIYGDWASTRPPREPVPMTLVPRIDYARKDGWPTWRSSNSKAPERASQYTLLAASAFSDLGLKETPTIWADFMIGNTRAGEEPAIKSPATAAAVRINAHLFTEATRDFGGSFVIEDEPVGDDL